MDFQYYCKSSSEKINQTIKNFFAAAHLQKIMSHPAIKELIDLYEERVMGGKCLRGILVKFGYELSEAQPAPEILKIGAAYEMLHTSLLILDDFIDKSPIRRGKPTIHTVLGNDEYAWSQTICLSDLGLFLATKLIADTEGKFDSDKRTLSFFSQTVINTILGEMLDSILARPDVRGNEQDVLTVYKYKTAHYSVAGPLLLGARLGNASKERLAALNSYGENIGIAFQIQDDILGVFGDEKVTGKSSRSDIEEGKNTLLFTFALANVSPKQKELLLRHYGKGELSDDTYEIIKNIFRDSGALAYAEEKAGQYVFIGKKSIPQITTNKIYQGYLADLADYTITRTK